MPKRESKTPPAKSKTAQILPSRPPRQREWAIWAVLILCVFVVYSDAGRWTFVTYDDPLYVAENFHVQTGLTAENVKWAFTTIVDNNWVPLTLISHMVTWSWFGADSGMHHWVNVLLHALSALLLFAWVKRATKALWPSAFVALIFAVHPLHVESVAWIAERKDVLSTFFWFLAAYAYVRYMETPGLRWYLSGWYVAMTVAFTLGLMAKPMLVTFPFTLLLLDVWPLRRIQFPKTVIEKLPLFALSAASSAATYFVQHSTGAVQALPLAQNLRNALVSYVGYLAGTFWPSGLAVLYPPRDGLTTAEAAGALVILAAISAAVIRMWRTRPYLATGWFWYLGTLVPVIGLVQVGIQSHADRYMYIPMVGLTMMLGWGGAEVVEKWPATRRWVVTAAGVAALASLAAAAVQTQYWRTSEALYRRAIDVTGKNYVAQYSLGECLMDVPGRGAEAIQHFEEALRIKPDSADAHNSIGAYLLQNGREPEAVSQFEAALRSQPNSAEAHFNMGLVLEKDPARLGEALAHYEAAVKARPDWGRAHRYLGVLLVKFNRVPDAIAQLEIAQRLEPDAQAARILEGLMLGRK